MFVVTLSGPDNHRVHCSDWLGRVTLVLVHDVFASMTLTLNHTHVTYLLPATLTFTLHLIVISYGHHTSLWGFLCEYFNILRLMLAVRSSEIYFSWRDIAFYWIVRLCAILLAVFASEWVLLFCCICSAFYV